LQPSSVSNIPVRNTLDARRAYTPLTRHAARRPDEYSLKLQTDESAPARWLQNMLPLAEQHVDPVPPPRASRPQRTSYSFRAHFTDALLFAGATIDTVACRLCGRRC